MVIHIYQSLHPPQASSNALLGFDLINYLLPDGVAVVESELKLTKLSASGSPNVGVWAMSNHDWDQEEVTWLESSTGTPWSGPGASGSNDITNLLDSQTVADGSHPFGNSCKWNITSAVQDSMRTQKDWT